jgi:cell surface protein SprA
VPANASNTEYSTMVNSYAAARNIDNTSSTLDGAGLVGGSDYEKLESARLLTSSEYTVNNAIGLRLAEDDFADRPGAGRGLRIYLRRRTYQVGEFASDITDTGKALFVKSLKNTSNNPSQGNWPLMMKNVY